jgi:hypothetical protein
MSAATPVRAAERRRNVRFELHFPVFLRAFGGPWSAIYSADVSATGALLVTERPVLLNTPVEYVMTFPRELTKASQALRVRFYASVLRCEKIPGGDGLFHVAVRNTAHRYLSKEESVAFDLMDSHTVPTGEDRPDPSLELET